MWCFHVSHARVIYFAIRCYYWDSWPLKRVASWVMRSVVLGFKRKLCIFSSSVRPVFVFADRWETGLEREIEARIPEGCFKREGWILQIPTPIRRFHSLYLKPAENLNHRPQSREKTPRVIKKTSEIKCSKSEFAFKQSTTMSSMSFPQKINVQSAEVANP